MRIRTVATLVATSTLLVGVGIGVFVATPGLAVALQDRPGTGTEPALPRSTWTPSPVGTSTPAPRPTTTYTGSLVAPTGSQVITRQQLHEWAASRPFFGEDPRNDAIWEQQTWLDIRCMARKGYLDDPTNPALADHEVSEADGLTAAQAKGYAVAMDGPPTDAPYDWRTAGCHGRSVHLTGMDDAH